MKKFIALILLSVLLFSVSGCEAYDNYKKKNFSASGFVCKVLTDGTLAVGEVSVLSAGDSLFVPYKINDYTVSQLGFSSGMGFGGNGELSTRFKRIYFPNTIKAVGSNNAYVANRIKGYKIFYCGTVMNLSKICTSRDYYVPYQQVEEFVRITPLRYITISQANVGYYLNYDQNNYYYVDYYENGEVVKYIPPIPEREGYTFGGWFKESECINQWDFETDTVQTDEDNEEVGLYAKWIKN